MFLFSVKAGGMRITTKAHPQHLPTPEQKAEDQKFMEEEQISESLEEKYDSVTIMCSTYFTISSF